MTAIVYRRGSTEHQDSYLKRALHAARDLYPKYKESRGSAHPSFAAADTLERVRWMFPDIGDYGVEGFCGPTGEKGLTYLNAGDSYKTTVCFESEKERFVLRPIEYYADKFDTED